ncbi:hypothetical protein B0T19DRAFT_105369 [Cercophora scortea]|uniref:Uncharacterized protein n=1 Tax=Cercophora scortea TaxID=314031 RepID=A0AAE0IWH6_9PEZI|nr:hypothetical protein B0T19DRAFT_105369 [Cercophora scortea]
MCGKWRELDCLVYVMYLTYVGVLYGAGRQQQPQWVAGICVGVRRPREIQVEKGDRRETLIRLITIPGADQRADVGRRATGNGSGMLCFHLSTEHSLRFTTPHPLHEMHPPTTLLLFPNRWGNSAPATQHDGREGGFPLRLRLRLRLFASTPTYSNDTQIISHTVSAHAHIGRRLCTTVVPWINFAVQCMPRAGAGAAAASLFLTCSQPFLLSSPLPSLPPKYALVFAVLVSCKARTGGQRRRRPPETGTGTRNRRRCKIQICSSAPELLVVPPLTTHTLPSQPPAQQQESVEYPVPK